MPETTHSFKTTLNGEASSVKISSHQVPDTRQAYASFLHHVAAVCHPDFRGKEGLKKAGTEC